MDDDSKTNDEFETGGGEEAVRVFVRIRPLNRREIAEKQQIGWNYNETSMIEDTQNGQRVYAYDCCFGPNAANREVYDIVGKPVVLKAMEGYNGTVFTYGQTGSGKTWTMRGSQNDPGMMILCVRDIMEWMEAHSNLHYTLRVSYLEVYNEEINDLLSDGRNLRIVSEDAAKGAVIGGLVEEVVKTPQDFMEVLQRGEASRSYASTNMNDQSSRSHTIYRVQIEVTDDDDDGGFIDPIGGLSSFGNNRQSGPISRTSYLNLVDLAGSERQKQTNATGKTLKEGANINKSLLALGAVINKLGEACSTQHKKAKGAKPIFIPYRDSKLTRILKQSLGGNTLTSVLCAVTPAPMHREETVSTLKFGQLCKTIKNNVKSNEFLDDKALMKHYRSMINELKSQVEELQGGGGEMALKEKAQLISKVRAYENIIITNNLPLPEPEISDTASAAGSEATLDVSSYTGGDTGLIGKLLKDAKEESVRQNEKITELQRRIIVLQRQVDEHHDFEEAKALYEEYEHNVRQELDDEKARLELERQHIQSDKYKLLAERTNVEEKEGRLGLLSANLDERDSKLRQLLSTMKEQQEQWNRSIQDLQRREDLVEEWQRSHRQRETRLQEIHQQHEEKFLELNNRERELSEVDQKLQLQQRELSERDQRLHVAMSRVANAEQALSSAEAKLHQNESNLKKREGDCDIKERELQIRRREMESWDTLLREKDRKISAEQRALDEREENIRSTEEKIRHREADIERKLIDVRQSEALIQELRETYNSNLAQLEAREKAYQVKSTKLQATEADLSVRESNLNSWESALQQLQYRLQGIEEREAELKVKIEAHKRVEEEFFNVKVAQITARHSREMGQLEQMLQQQLKIVGNFQADLTKAREELMSRCQERDSLKNLVEERDQLITQLKYELQVATSENQAFASSLFSSPSSKKSTSANGSTAGGGLEEIKAGTPAHPKSGPTESSKTNARILAVKPTAPGGVVTAANVQFVDPLAEGKYDTDSDAEDIDVSSSAGTPGGASRGKVAPTRRDHQKDSLRVNSSQDFLMQLAEAQRLIHQILVNHNALPSENEPLFYRPFSKRADKPTQQAPEMSNAQALQHMQQLFNQFAGRHSGLAGKFDPSMFPGNPLLSSAFAAQFLGASQEGPTALPGHSNNTAGSTGASSHSGVPTSGHNNTRGTVGANHANPTVNLYGSGLKRTPANRRGSDTWLDQSQSQLQSPSAMDLRRSSLPVNLSKSPTNVPGETTNLSIRGILRNSSANTTSGSNTAGEPSSTSNANGVPKTADKPVVIVENSHPAPPKTPSRSMLNTPVSKPRQSSPLRSTSPSAAGGRGSPDLTGLVATGERNGIPVTTVSLQFASTRKLVNQVIVSGSSPVPPPPPLPAEVKKKAQLATL